MRDQEVFVGECLCGDTKFQVTGSLNQPHLCSCTMCRVWCGAPTVPWVSAPRSAFKLVGNNTALSYFQSSENTKRGRCSTCGSPICADNNDESELYITLCSFDADTIDGIVPDEWHYQSDSVPNWWNVSLGVSLECVAHEKNSID